jgi:hypothetical protein
MLNLKIHSTLVEKLIKKVFNINREKKKITEKHSCILKNIEKKIEQKKIEFI